LTFRMGFGQLMVGPGQYPIADAGAELLGMGPPKPDVVAEPDEWMRRLGSLPLMYQPGERWVYDTPSDVLGVVIARASGRPFDVFLRERIFEPLGMHDTGFSVPAGKIDRFVTLYASDADGALVVYDDADGGRWSRPPAFPSGRGGLVSTADDYLAFGEMLRNRGLHGTTRILARPTVEVMTRNHLTPEQLVTARPILEDDRGWGFGMAVVTRGDNPAWPVGKFGWDGGLGSSAAMDPSEELTGVLLTNASWMSPLPPRVYADFWTGVYQAIDD